MCGIVGILHSEAKGAVDSEILHLMNHSLRHRGPDDEGYWIKRNVGLGMRRLSIIDLEGGHQPISNETEDVWTVFNGEIYNFAELRAELIKKNHRFRTRTDTEVIVHLYEEEGEEFVHKLRGMFAIALWDERRQKLLLYRDRVGIKPLLYWHRNGSLVFASEIKAILEYPDVEREISIPALSAYLSFLYIPSPDTIYQNIQKLPPGHWLSYENGNVRVKPYWDFSYRVDENCSETEWVEKLRDALAESVKFHLISDVPVGAFLSGGVDSSTVVAWMSRESNRPVKTYSIGFGEDRFNELPYARRVASLFRTEHHEKVLAPDAFQLLPKIVAGFDEPFGDSSAIPTYLVSEFAKQDVKVALSGDGGDELFGGYLWTRKEIWLEEYRRLPSAFRSAAEKFFLRDGYRPLREGGILNAFRRFLFDAQGTPFESFARRSRSFQPWMKQQLFEPWVLQELEFAGREEQDFMDSILGRHSTDSVIDQLLYWDSKVYLPDDLLTKVDCMSMMHSLEVRVPLLDHKVVELACSIPNSLKFKQHTTKYILKRAMKDLLPAQILKQRKQGFSIPLQTWFSRELYPLAKSFLTGSDSMARRYFNPRYLQWLLEEHRAGRQRFGSQLYALLSLEIWLRLHEKADLAISLNNASLKLKDLLP